MPLIAVGLSIFLKFVSRRDGHKPIKKEDFAVGMDLAITAALLFITASSTVAQSLSSNPTDAKLIEKSQSVPWIIAAFLLGIWCISTLVRKLGWESDDKLKIFWGIIFPGIFGLSVLFFAVNWITQ